MPNGREVNDRLEFKNLIGKMSDRELAEDTALRTYDLHVRIGEVEDCVDPKKAKQTGATSGGIAGTIAAIIIAVISYFTNRSA